MSDEDKAGCGLAIMTLVLCGMAFWFGWNVGTDHQERAMHQEAVTAGHAHWAADQKTGEVKFEWLPVGAEKGK